MRCGRGFRARLFNKQLTLDTDGVIRWSHVRAYHSVSINLKKTLLPGGKGFGFVYVEDNRDARALSISLAGPQPYPKVVRETEKELPSETQSVRFVTENNNVKTARSLNVNPGFRENGGFEVIVWS